MVESSKPPRRGSERENGRDEAIKGKGWGMEEGQGFPNRKHLKRIPVWLPADHRVIYFVSTCCANRRRIFEETRWVNIANESLDTYARKTEWNVHHVCFMPDHVHLFVSPMQDREQKLSRFMQCWKSSVTQRMRSQGFSGPVWQAEFFDHLLRSNESLSEKWVYVRMNPVRAGLCKDPDEYPFLGTPEEIRHRIVGRSNPVVL
jgi:putative transposase